MIKVWKLLEIIHYLSAYRQDQTESVRWGVWSSLFTKLFWLLAFHLFFITLVTQQCEWTNKVWHTKKGTKKRKKTSRI